MDAATNNVVAWLLDGDAAIQFAARTRLLGEDVDSGACRRLRARVMREGIVPAILATQGTDGHWAGRDRFYSAKYSGTVWNLIILAEVGADGADVRLRRAAEAVLTDAQHPASGGFSVQRSKTTSGGLPSGVIPCLTGNLVFALVRLGMLDDPRVQAAIDWIATYQRFDDGDGDPSGWPYDRYEMCWGRHTCSMGVVKALKGLAEVPLERRSVAVRATLDSAAEFVLVHHVHKRSHDLGQVSKPGWKRFGFPRMYQTDVLEILWLLTKLGYRDPRLDEALDLVCAKRGKDGRWNLDDTFNDTFSVPIETRGQPSRWVTLRALEVLAPLDHG
ncbi:MAG TPA: hypothetical protein VGK53_18525 [Propionicimonas sp.]